MQWAAMHGLGHATLTTLCALAAGSQLPLRPELASCVAGQGPLLGTCQGDASTSSPSEAWQEDLSEANDRLRLVNFTSPLWEIRVSPGKGLGMFATAPIPRFATILTEAPVLTLPPIGAEEAQRTGYPLAAMAAAVDAGFARLTPPEQAAFLSCAGPAADSGSEEARLRLDDGSEVSPAAAIFRNNAYALAGGTAALFPAIAKINHSCRPNAAHTARGGGEEGGEGVRVVWAATDIWPGEEISLTYVPLTEGREARRARTRRGYGFECGCEACREAEAEGEGGDAARARMGELLGLLNGELLGRGRGRPGGAPTGRDVRDEADELLVMLDEEHLGDYYLVALRLAALANLRAGDGETARRMVEDELALHEVIDPESEGAAAARTILARL